MQKTILSCVAVIAIALVCFSGVSTTVSYFQGIDVAERAVIQKSSEQYQGVLAHAGTVTLDFDANQTLASCALTGNITLAFSNLSTNRNYRLLLQNSQATNCTITYPAGIHGYYSTTITNATWMMLSAEAWGAADANVWVSTSNEGTY